MLNLLALRIISFAIVYLLSSSFDLDQYYFLFIVNLYTHYLMQVQASKNIQNSIIELPISTHSTLVFIARIAFLFTLFYISQYTPYLPMPLYFGIHFVLSEMYSREAHQILPLRRMFHFFTCTAIYSLFCRELNPFLYLNPLFYYLLFWVGIFGLLYSEYWDKYFSKSKATQNAKSALPLVGYELIGLLLTFVTPIHDIPLPNIIFYHVVWWGLYPLVTKSWSTSNIKLFGKYLAITLVLWLGLYFVLADFKNNVFQHLADEVFFYGSLHITASFLLSSSHPRLINKLFGKVVPAHYPPRPNAELA